MTIVVRPCISPSRAWLDEVVGAGVDAGGGLVQDQDAGVDQDGPGDGEALALAAGEAHPPLADQGVVALRELGDEVVRVRRPRRRLDLLLGRLGAPVADVLARRSVEQEGLLHHHADLGAQGLQRRRRARRGRRPAPRPG